MQSKTAIPIWVPAAARKRIAELLTGNNLTESDRGLIDRLATYDAMKTNVWEKLPKEPLNLQGELIDYARFAATSLSSLVPRPGPKAKQATYRRWSEILHENPPWPSAEFAGLLAAQLFGEMHSLRDEIDSYWSIHWRGDQSITPSRLTETLENLALFFDAIDKERQSRLKLLPTIRRPYSKATPLNHFARLMSDWFQSRYGAPLDEIVTTLTEIAFDIPGDLAQENIRALRRAEKTRRRKP